MPRGDRTGPMGRGPATGRGLGYCGGNEAAPFGNAGSGLGLGLRRGLGRGFGWRHRFFATGQMDWGYPHYAPPTREEMLSAFKAQADWLKGQLDAINRRIEELNE